MKRISGEQVPMVPRPNPVRLPYGPRPSGRMRPTPGAFTICTATFGNGRPIGSGGIPSGDCPIRKVLPPVCPVSSEVVPGSFPLPTFDLPLEAEALPATVLTTWDSALLSSRSNKDSLLLQVLSYPFLSTGFLEEGCVSGCALPPAHVVFHFSLH